METTDTAKHSLSRRNAIPILYARGTHYEVGFDVGRNFSSIIKEFVDSYAPLTEYIDMYSTDEGRDVYDKTLEVCKETFPQYVKELEGISEGSGVEFYKLFLIHMDEIMPQGVKKSCKPSKEESFGCTTIMVNRHDCQVLAHNEDALAETLNRFYMVDLHIIEDSPQGKYNTKEEHFVSLCYAGCLPGYTMSYNHHGLIFSINTNSAEDLTIGKIPRVFLTRALLAADNIDVVIKILKDKCGGAADGCTINCVFLRRNPEDVTFYNIEMGPVSTDIPDESQVDIKPICIGQYNYHANTFLRLKVQENNELMKDSTNCRLNALCSYCPPKTKSEILKMLGDTSTTPHTVFRDNGEPDELVKTIAIGVFDLQCRTFSIYADNPRQNAPLIVLNLYTKK